MRGNAPCGVKGVMGYALSARGIFARAKMPNVSIAVYVPPGRCPGLRATIGLTARPNHLTSVLHNVELVKIRATYQVAIKTIENVSCKFVKFVGK